jgi:hypothetical protein
MLMIKRNHIKVLCGLLFAAVALFIVADGSNIEKPAAIKIYDELLPDYVDYNLHVKSILSDKCYTCHGPDKNNGQKAGLDLSTPASALAVLSDGKRAIVPGKLGKSELYHRIVSEDPGTVMPTRESGLMLTGYEKAVIIRWIEQGAVFKPHWAYTRPAKPKLPEVKEKNWPINPIDFFVLKTIDDNHLRHAPAADKETLLRRVSLDLTGLPPSPDEVDAFLRDTAADAYEKVINQLLQSPHYGEKMAVDWLDVSRFADTHGYTIDLYRPMWPWRDWVIQSFNENMPFDRFITWQLAGDLLPQAGRQQRLATAFNRLHPQNMEGGIINEEFMTEYAVDRVNTFGTAFLGLTISCARCHDHKYDPISQKDFYSLYSFFNNIDEVGQISRDGAMPVPTMLLPDAEQDSLLANLNKMEKSVRTELDVIVKKEIPDFEQWKKENHGIIHFDKRKGLKASFTFDRISNGYFTSEINARDTGYVTSDINTTVIRNPGLVPGKRGNAFKSNGNDILRLGNTGIFNRFASFSISTWVHIPRELDKGVILHTGNGDILYNFRGYYLNIRHGKAELLMAHSWPYNSIVKVSNTNLPKEEWIHLTLTYDGSSMAQGLKLFINGREEAMITEKDNLYKDILFTHGYQPGLQIGADLRGFGFKNGLVDEVVIYNRELTSPEIRLQANFSPDRNDSVCSDADLSRYYFLNVSKQWQQKSSQLQQIRLRKNKITEDIPEVMVMDELKKKRPTYILQRGVYDAPAEEVDPDVPAAILPFSPLARRDRLGLAAWLTDPKNPLTARVVVNRFWQTYFGSALQQNADNFGNQGGVPTHPELLDWLAISFVESGWNVKAMQKLIVMSATYRQSSYDDPAGKEKDPANRLLARGPAFRLSAEMVRDAALKASGLLSRRIGGPSVMPYQPEGLWQVNDVEEYKQDTGENLYRRGIYTFIKRTNPPPSMSAFDAPTRTNCTVLRQKTSTPMQALVLLNDPQFREASRVLAANALKKYATHRERIQYCYRLLTCRKPAEKEMEVLQKLFTDEYKKFKRQPGRMKGWLTAGDHKLGAVKEPEVLAALTVTANTIMNSDAFITKR